MTTENDKHSVEVYQLRFWFVGVQPIVWRRLLIRSDQTLADLHYAIQICCSWSDYYLYQFKIHGKTYGVPRLHGICYTQSAKTILLSDLH
ncbi:MAG: plasmid pRiA4b ORF-3 family protein, partial [Chloroflexota bacterium]